VGYEIELKAHVASAESTAGRIARFADFLFAYEKEDVYWYNGSAAIPSGVRVRTESRTAADGTCSRCTLVTYKRQEKRGGVEVNEEKEFCVSPPDTHAGDTGRDEAAAAVFRELLTRAGFSAGFTKTKSGSCWRCAMPDAPPVTIELSLVEPLGWFLELEIVQDTERRAADARQALYAVLKKAGIPRSCIEPRYYSEMLQNKGAGL
jgi:adenylate cyclase class 2